MKRTQKQWQNAFPEPSMKFHRKVEATLASLPQEKEKCFMKFNKRFAVPVMACILVLALGTGLIATGTVTKMFGGSSTIPAYTEVPTAEQLSEDLDFVPVVPATLGDGYTYEESVIGKEKGTDDNGNVLSKNKFLNSEYKNGTDQLNLYSSPQNDLVTLGGVVIENYNGIDLHYLSYASKLVPADYELTAQDKADKASGKYEFSYGDVDEVSITEVQQLLWIMNGVSYDILVVDSDLTQADLVAMAKEIIDK